MVSIAELLDRAKAGGKIESDYRLAKVIGITHGAMTHYRMNRTMPDERVLEQLCALSGDDVAVFAAACDVGNELVLTRVGKQLAQADAVKSAGLLSRLLQISDTGAANDPVYSVASSSIFSRIQVAPPAAITFLFCSGDTTTCKTGDFPEPPRLFRP